VSTVARTTTERIWSEQEEADANKIIDAVAESGEVIGQWRLAHLARLPQWYVSQLMPLAVILSYQRYESQVLVPRRARDGFHYAITDDHAAAFEYLRTFFRVASTKARRAEAVAMAILGTSADPDEVMLRELVQAMRATVREGTVDVLLGRLSA
jgi:hypothetical protein